MSMNKIGQVISSAPNCIIVEIQDLSIFEENKNNLQIGCYLKIAQGNQDYTITVINNLKGIDSSTDESEPKWQFLIECQAIGNLINDQTFDRGALLLPVPTEPVYMADQETLDKLFVHDTIYNFPFGELSLNRNITLMINGDMFFSKHIAVVGSTGSGKSFTVAKIIHDVVGINSGKNLNLKNQNNSHIVIFDIHDEYKAAFSLQENQLFTLNVLDIDTLKLPYWLMNSEELESIFIESNEANSHNQISQFKHAVILNKEKHNPLLKEITYDTPVYFSIEEVYNYIENMNREIIGRLQNENVPKLEDGTLIEDRKDFYFDKTYDFVRPSTAQATKATNGPFNGEFHRFTSRLENKLSDKRLNFLFHPIGQDGKPYRTEDFQEIMKQFLGYLNKSNITIVDLSGIPFEVLSITVSLVSRLIFDFCFHY